MAHPPKKCFTCDKICTGYQCLSCKGSKKNAKVSKSIITGRKKRYDKTKEKVIECEEEK